MSKKIKVSTLLIFIVTFFCFSICLNSVSAKDDDKQKTNCLFCQGDKETYKTEQQFMQRIKVIKQILGRPIDEVALAATVLHKENSVEAIGSRYTTNKKWKSDYKSSMKGLFDNSTTEKQLGDNSGMTESDFDILTAAAIIMADSAGWNRSYNEEKYQEALAGDSFIANNPILNTIFCVPADAVNAGISIGDSTYTFVTGSQAIRDDNGAMWYNRANICHNGYIGGVYNITPETEPNAEIRKAKKEEIAKEIIDLIKYYRLLTGSQACAAGTTISGNTQASDLAGKSREERIEVVGPAAGSVHAATGVWASVTIGQLILESNIGAAYEGTSFISANNLMGVKCRTGRDCMNGYAVFSSIEDALQDRVSMFDNGMYGDWRSASTPEAFIRMVAPVYCPVDDGCDPNYSETIIGFINQYDLKQFDYGSGGLICKEDYSYNGVVTDKMKKVADLARQRAGGGYDKFCEGWVEQIWSEALGISADNQFSAYSAWKNFGVSESKDNIPPGAMVYTSGWPYYDDGTNPYGHVGVYVGNGQVADQGGVWDIEEWINQQNAPCNGLFGWFGWGWQNNLDLTK